MDAALGRRSVATLRARFEALRPDGPIPALMAEIPADHPAPFDERETHPRPPVSDFHRPDLFYLGWDSVYGPGPTSASRAVAHRCHWLAGPSIALVRLRDSWRDAAAFASDIRVAAGLAVGSRAGNAENHWLWTMFEVAERRVAFSPLKLRGGSVTVAHGECHFPAPRVTATRAHPEWCDPLSQIIRAADPGPTRYWEIVDAVEASLMLLDLAEVAMSEAPARDARKALEAPQPLAETPKNGRSHKRTVDGLTVNQWVVAMAVKDRGFRHLSERDAAGLGPFGARTIGKCEMWVQMKADLETEAREKAERAEAELEDRQSEDEDANGLRRRSTKSGIGRQRTAPEDLEQERNVEDFLRSKGEQPSRSRAK